MINTINEYKYNIELFELLKEERDKIYKTRWKRTMATTKLLIMIYFLILIAYIIIRFFQSIFSIDSIIAIFFALISIFFTLFGTQRENIRRYSELDLELKKLKLSNDIPYSEKVIVSLNTWS